MLGWIKTLTKNFNKLPSIGQFAVAVVIIIVIRYLMHLIIYSKFLSTYLENFGNPKELVYFYMNGCGHCKRFTPVWDEFSKNYNGELKLKKLERKEAGDMLQKYEIQGTTTEASRHKKRFWEQYS